MEWNAVSAIIKTKEHAVAKNALINQGGLTYTSVIYLSGLTQQSVIFPLKPMSNAGCQ